MKSIFANRPPGVIGVLFLALSALVEAQAPVVHKVEPPNWWVNYTPELTPLLTGENLFGARSDASSNEHYLFLFLRLNVSSARLR
jgi:hypothetical protein